MIVDSKGRTLEQFLAEYRPGDFPRPSVTADCVILTNDRRVLLVKRGNHPELGKWALPGGFVNPNETAVEAAARELVEETGVTAPVRQLLTLSNPKRDKRTWIISVVCTATIDKVPPKAGDDAAEAGWFELSGERKGNDITVRAGTHTALVKVTRDAFGRVDADKSECSGEIAFDHAAVLAYVLEENKWI